MMEEPLDSFDSPFAEDAPSRFHLAMWGPASAGKTVLLVQLLLVHPSGEWNIDHNPASIQFVTDMQARIRAGLFPPATGLSVDKIEFQFKHKRTGREISLRVEDRAGSESMPLQDSVRQQLKTADGLVLVFDLLAADTTRQLTELLKALNETRRRNGSGVPDSRPIVICLSKADEMIETVEDLEQAVNDPESFVRERDRWGLVKEIARYYSRVRFYPVSAAGVRRTSGVIQPVVFYDQELRPRLAPGGEPLNVVAPFEWLLDQVVGGA